ncbi:MAG: M23 family metallopeptidase [Eubacteriales bacterium]|nr:M23 family metallopeptidase [Eubacteriales bacterium]
MRNADHKKTDKIKIVSMVISLGVILTLAWGIFSVIGSVNSGKNKNNIVDLNETEGNVAIKTRDSEEEDVAREANAQGQMAEIKETMAESEPETEKTKEATTEEPTVPPTLSSEEVMAQVMKNYAFDESHKLMRPVSGEISLGYSMDNTILFKSLGMYKCNPAVIIKAEVGTNVAVAASGVVTDVAQMQETGTTVTVSLGNGYETTTGLIEGVVVKRGDTVTKGQLLGTVANPTAYYKEEGPGVYFKLAQFGEPIDPDSYFEE